MLLNKYLVLPCSVMCLIQLTCALPINSPQEPVPAHDPNTISGHNDDFQSESRSDVVMKNNNGGETVIGGNEGLTSTKSNSHNINLSEIKPEHIRKVGDGYVITVDGKDVANVPSMVQSIFGSFGENKPTFNVDINEIFKNMKIPELLQSTGVKIPGLDLANFNFGDLIREHGASEMFQKNGIPENLSFNFNRPDNLSLNAHTKGSSSVIVKQA